MTRAQLRRGRRLGSKTVRFTFDGRDYVGREGDTAASALLAAGVQAFGRSVKYRRLRGVMAAGPEEPNALLTIGTPPAVIPNAPASRLPLREGLELRSQNRWPSLRWDVASLLQAGGGFFGAGFYYKTFMWPAWRTYEPLIRRLAGLGEAPGACDLPVARIEYRDCDVLVAGAGPAGLAAGLAAARAGARVTIVEREPVIGGELEFETATIDGRTAHEWIGVMRQELETRGASLLTATTLVGGTGGLYQAHSDWADRASTVHKIRPRAFVQAMGAVERPIAFVDNDRPGVMLLGAAERYSACHGALDGRTAVLFANHDRVYAAGVRLLDAGVRIRAVIDRRVSGPRSASAAAQRERLASAGAECLAGHVVVATLGRRSVSGAAIAPVGGGARRVFDCDLILVSAGWSPAMHAGVQEGGERGYVADHAAFRAEAQPQGRFVAGAASATFELGAVLREGSSVGAAAASLAGFRGDAADGPRGTGDGVPEIDAFWRSPCELSQEKRQFVDLQNDVTVADLRAALAEGFVDIEHVKRYTTLGVGTEQGRTSGTLGSAILAELKGGPLAGVGISRPRPPYHPVTLQSLAGLRVGDALRVTRRTPLHGWHAAHGGVLDPMGLWLRPRYYRGNGTDAFAAAVNEARRVRATGGVLDGSTLGKIEIAGPDAAAFLDTLYLSRASTIKVGRAKYMVNLREDGMALDDGLVLRIGPDRFFATTSSGHAGHMLSHFEHYRDVDWDGRRVTVTDVTDSWVVIAVAGPHSRAALQAVLGDAWRPLLDRIAHMDFARGRFGGCELTVLRAGFSGEHAYELHVRPAGAIALWEALVASGLEPYGLDALDILRVEKGYLTSSELNGETTPHDLNMGALVRLGNPCIGRELLDRPGLHEPSRPRLVGLRAADGKARILGGAQLTLDASSTRPCGYVTSAAYSPALEQWIALALVSRSHAAEGTALVARDPLREGDSRVLVTSPVHFDPTGERMKP
jgi:heterotetrameric sarcosine oxidase alpha subunit